MFAAPEPCHGFAVLGQMSRTVRGLGVLFVAEGERAAATHDHPDPQLLINLNLFVPWCLWFTFEEGRNDQHQAN
jgi:hypothetical protein